LGVLWNDISTNSNGGTELLCRRLEAALPQELLDQVQIVPSRLYGELDPTKIRILYLHDLPHDPESKKIFESGDWKKFHKIVCVSQWQMQHYIEAYNLPWSAFVVLPNSIEPITRSRPWMEGDKINLIYHTTPHRGLDIAHAVVDKLSQEYDNIHLDVFSSFKAYGWPEQDAQFSDLFKKIEDHPAMTYHGYQPNETIREYLAKSDIFAYPSVWPETSCLALMEAMSAGVMCIHPNFAALPETASNWTMMYQFHEDRNQHAGIFYSIVKMVLDTPVDALKLQLNNQKSYVDIFYNWNNRKNQWAELIQSLGQLPRGFPKETWSYKY
jgi:UDP-glucose:(glucosyl)LPS alpha-1,2-glucosyltransferase